jgi:hypothetical protein
MTASSLPRVLFATALVAALGCASAAGCNALTGIGELQVTSGGGQAGGTHGTTAHGGAGTGGKHTGGAPIGGAPQGGAPQGGGDAGPSTCVGVTCSGHGTCSDATGTAVCSCEFGYHAVGDSCVVDETCAGKSCGQCGQCQVVKGVAQCSCPQDYAWTGTDCKLAIDPCANANCTIDEYCVPEAHCQALGACVQTCDCSNCPNCGPDNSDGRWNDWQEYCGAAPNQSPATMACTRPCPAGTGCLPYNPGICWPMEGCFSL